MLQPGDVIGGKYRLVRLLGEGGMGAVFEARHEMLGSTVALKAIHPELVRRPGLAERFLQEARVAAQIRSPHVVQVADIDKTSDGVPYMVMELLEGEALGAVLDRQKRLSVPTAVEYTRQVLVALEAAHTLGVVHRDLKPENVFVTLAGGRPVLKLIDFGIAKVRRSESPARALTAAGVTMGTAEYMAPEQAYSADQADARSDVYAVGVMLYEMIAGVRPVIGLDARKVAEKVARGEVTALVHVAPETPRELAGLVHRAMAARPEMRFQSATEMRLALETLGGGSRTVAAAPNVSSLGGNNGPTTERAPPVGSYGSPYAAAPAPHPAMAGTSRKRTQVPWAYALVPLGLGSAAVAIFVALQEPRAVEPPPPLAPSAAATGATTAIPSPRAPATVALEPMIPLTPTPRQPARPVIPSGAVVRDAQGAPADELPGATLPASPFPTAVPPFPTTMPPFPSAFPFPVGLPEGGVLAIPSSFPFPFPFPSPAPLR